MFYQLSLPTLHSLWPLAGLMLGSLLMLLGCTPTVVEPTDGTLPTQRVATATATDLTAPITLTPAAVLLHPTATRTPAPTAIATTTRTPKATHTAVATATRTHAPTVTPTQRPLPTSTDSATPFIPTATPWPPTVTPLSPTDTPQPPVVQGIDIVTFDTYGPPPNCYPDCPLEFIWPGAPVEVRETSTNQVVASGASDSGGHFRVNVAPGTYRACLLSSNGDGSFACTGDLVVGPGNYVSDHLTRINV